MPLCWASEAKLMISPCFPFDTQFKTLPCLWKFGLATVESTGWQWMDLTIYCYKQVIHKPKTAKATNASKKLYVLTYGNNLHDCYLITRCTSPDTSLQLQMIGELQLTIMELLLGSPNQALPREHYQVLHWYFCRINKVHWYHLKSVFLTFFSLIFTYISFACRFLEFLFHTNIMFVIYWIF